MSPAASTTRLSSSPTSSYELPLPLFPLTYRPAELTIRSRTVLTNRTTEEHLSVLPSFPRKEIMMPLSRYEPDLTKGTSPRHFTIDSEKWLPWQRLLAPLDPI